MTRNEWLNAMVEARERVIQAACAYVRRGILAQGMTDEGAALLMAVVALQTLQGEEPEE